MLRRRPTEIERTAMRRASLLVARAEMAAADPNATHDDVVRLDGAARRAERRVIDLIGIKRQPTAPRLHELLEAEEAAE
jgi:hypothetical protein